MFDPTKTEVLTPSGWRYIDEIDRDDLVACVKPDILGISFDKVKFVLHMENVEVQQLDDTLSATAGQKLFFYAEGGKSVKKTGLVQALTASEVQNKITLLSSGTYISPKGIDISSREMVFLLLVQADGFRDYKNHCILFNYASQDKVDYIIPVFKKLGYTDYVIAGTTIRLNHNEALELYDQYFDGNEFKWIWLNMDTTQADYFLYRITNHYHSSWDRVYHSESKNNRDLVQAVAILNQRGSYIVEQDQNVFTTGQLRCLTIDPNNIKTNTCEIVKGLDVGSKYLIIRQNGYTTIVCTY